MLLQEKHISCSWAPGTMTAPGLTSSLLSPYCFLQPLLLLTAAEPFPEAHFHHSFFYFFLSPFQPPHPLSSVRYPPSLIFSQKPFKGRKLCEKESSFHIFDKLSFYLFCLHAFLPPPPSLLCLYKWIAFKQRLHMTSYQCREKFSGVVFSDISSRSFSKGTGTAPSSTTRFS